MKVVIRQTALRDLDEIQDWISRESPAAATKVVRRLRTRINHLAVRNLSQIGRPGIIAGTRELLEPPYLVIYTIDPAADAIVVLSIVHTARHREPEV